MASETETPKSASASAETSSPTKDEPKGPLAVSEALQYLNAGKRDYLCRDYPSAVTSLAEASRLLGETYGETAVECADAYYYYGKALLELARLESGVIQGLPDDDEESEENSEEEEDAKEEEEKVEEGQTEDKEKVEEEKGEKEKGEEEKGEKEEEEATKGDNGSIGSNEAGTSEIKDSKDQTEIDQEELEDPSNLQLSWEMLELAKSLYKKHADSLEAEDAKRMELESRLSETYQILGEVSIENENYAQACEDLTCCLRRRQELLPEDSRCIAETHYQLGVALGFNLEFDLAVGSLNDAIGVLEKRISNLKEKKESEDSAVKKDAFYTREREILEIESLLPEIREKIADTKDMQVETFKKLGDKALMEEREIEAASISNGHSNGKAEEQNGFKNGDDSKSKPVSDISHMIKKRKKPDDCDNSSPAKKQNVGTSNGN